MSFRSACVSLFLILAVGVQARAVSQPSDLSGAASVMLDGAEVFSLQSRVLSFSPAERAQAISDRLESLKGMDPSKLRLEESQSATLALFGDTALFSVTDADAKAAGCGRKELAQRWLAAVNQALLDWRAGHRWQHWARQVGWALLSVLVFVLGAWLLQKGRGRLQAFIESKMEAFPSVKVGRIVLISKARAAEAAKQVAQLLSLVLFLVLAYFTLTAFFSSFDSTRQFSKNLLTYLFDPLNQAWSSLVAYIPNLLRIAVGSVVIYYAIKLLHFIFRHVHEGDIELPGFEREWAMPTHKIVRVLVIILGVIVLAPYLPGAKSPAFQGVSLFLGVLISLSSSSAISNIIAGTILIYTSAFKVGDRVRIGDTQGLVLERTLLVTRIRTTKNVVVTVPNAMVLSGKIENESAKGSAPKRILHSSVTIGYDSPWPQVHALLLGAIQGVEGALSEPPPFVLQTKLDDFYVAYELNFSTDRPEVQEKVLSQVHANIQGRFAAAKVEILSPHYRAVRRGPEALPEGLD